MSDTEPPRPPGRRPRPRRPVWWWFLVHGVIIALWGGFALVSPVAGAPGWVLDGTVYGIMLLLGGAQLVLQSWGARHTGPGWLGLFLGGAFAILGGFACFVVGGMRDATLLLWLIVGFLAIEGGIFIVGTVRDPVYRLWGRLMGGIIYLAVVVLVVVYFAFGGDFDVLDPVLGSLALLYGISVFVAAIQVRDSGINRASTDP